LAKSQPELKLAYTPLAKQQEFHESDAKYRCFAGGRGSGKTLCGAAEAIMLSLEFNGNYGLVGRMTMPELKKTAMKEVLEFPVSFDNKVMPLVSSPLIKRWDKQNSELTFVNGSVIFFTHLDDVTWKQRGLNLGFVWVDELTEIAEEEFSWLGSNLRRKGVRPVMFGTTNPEGHDWVWKRFIAEKKDNHFITISTSKENPHLPDDYIEDLEKTMPEEWIKRFIYCSFETYSGLVYPEYRDGNPYLVRGYDLDETLYRFIALDYGFKNPTGVLWGAVDRNGDVLIYDELYVKETLISEVAQKIKDKTGRQRIQMWLIDPSCRNRDGKTGRSIIDEYAENGIYFEGANNNVNAGINHVKEFLKIRPNGKPRLRFMDHLKNLRSEMQTYRWKDLKIGAVENQKEKPIKKDDHLLDPLRYMVNFLYATPSLMKKSKDFDYKRDILSRSLVNSSREWMTQ